MQWALQQRYHGEIVRAFDKRRGLPRRMHRIRVTATLARHRTDQIICIPAVHAVSRPGEQAASIRLRR